MIRGKKYYISISMRKSSCISRQVLTGPTHQAPRSLTPGRKRYGTFLCPVNNTQGRATGSQRKERGERLTFLTNCGGLGKGQVRECLQRNPDRKKKKNHVATRVAQTYRGGFAIFNSVSPRWLQGPSGKGFPPAVLIINSTPGTKISNENK